MATQSVLSLFQSLGHTAWWDSRYVTQGYNGRNELGQDFGLPLNTPVASISSGRVVYAQQMNSNPGSSVGYIVQVENADGSVFHYQHLRTSSVQVGDYVRAGQIVGVSGGCPANGYGSGGCRYTDQYTTGPHIEVRYTPHYDANAGAWNQNWIDPQGAFQAFGGSQTSDLMPDWATNGPAGLLSQGAGSVLQLPSNFAAILGNGLGLGISKGLGQFVQDEIHPFLDIGIRTFLVTVGVVLGVVALFAIGVEGGRGKVKELAESPAGEAATGAIGAEAGGQVAKAVVPAFGDRARGRVIEQPPKALAAPSLPQLPAPSEPEVYKADAVAAQHRAKRAAQYQDIEATAREIRPPDLPLPKDAEAGAQRRQVENRVKRDEREAQRRIDRNMKRRRRA